MRWLLWRQKWMAGAAHRGHVTPPGVPMPMQMSTRAPSRHQSMALYLPHTRTPHCQKSRRRRHQNVQSAIGQGSIQALRSTSALHQVYVMGHGHQQTRSSAQLSPAPPSAQRRACKGMLRQHLHRYHHVHYHLQQAARQGQHPHHLHRRCPPPLETRATETL